MDLPSGTVMLDRDFGATVVNATDVPNEAIYTAMQHSDQDLLRALSGWVQSTRLEAFDTSGYSGIIGPGWTGNGYGAPFSRNGGLFMRDRYLAPVGIFDQMRLARHAADTDDVVSGVIETTESLAFTGMDFYAEDPDEEDAYNQMGANIDLDRRMREIWRDLFIYSQCYIAVWWAQQSFKIRGKTVTGNQRRKTIQFVAPQELTLLDPLKVVPVGSSLFGREQLAYIADGGEHETFLDISTGEVETDEIVTRLISGPYTPDRTEAAELSQWGIDVRRLWLLNPNNVFRHTATRPGYRRFAAIRMHSIFELLDAKQQLRQMERAHLIGATNFIVVVRKGTDALPAQPAEIANLQAQVRTVARVPVMVGDHRLSVEIVTPKLDNTLRAERWNTIDARIAARCYQMFLLGNYCLSEDTEIMTADGWKTHDRVNAGDEVLTLNPSTGASEWQPCSDVNRFEHEGELVAFEGRSISALSTDNHRWWVRRKLGNGVPGHVWEFRTTDKLNDWCAIPLAAPHADFPVVPKYSDALVELVAWYWTEGCNKRDSAGVEIGQSETVNPGHCLRIEAALRAELGDSGWSTWIRQGHRTFGIHAAFGRVLRALAPDKVPSPEFFRALTAAQLELFITRSVDADGHIDALGKRMIAQKDERRIRSFEMACALAGIATATHFDGRLFRLTLKSLCFTNPHRSSRNEKSRVSIDRVPYKGIVWCPTTPNGTWLARRNGTVYWTGNSAGAAGDDSIKLVKVIARGMESRRHMIRRTLEKNVFRPMYENNEQLTSVPKLQFHPRAIALDFDAAYASFLFDLRQAKEISRATTLNQFDLDEPLEAELRQRERELYDDIFQTQVPFTAPNQLPPNPNQPPANPAQAPPAEAAPRKPLPKDNGGGRRNGGGAAPGTGQGQSPRRQTRKTAPRKAAAQITIEFDGADSLTAEDLTAALRAAFTEGPEDADVEESP